MSMDAWTLAALAALGMGIAAIVGGRWRTDLGEWSRALIMTAFALYISGAAWRTGETYVVWFSGFFVCAALHRWIDAVQQMRVQGAE
jgi:cell division protein FtsW (lipid II flippase)